MRRLVGFLLAGAGIAVVLAVALSGGSSYVIRVRLADADGLRPQSPVMIGGVPAGTVSLDLAPNDQVIAELHINHSQAPVGRNASVAIAAVNFLGQEEAELTRGDLADPAPSGYTIPASNVSVSTDLDQVLDVLDPDTRARLAILIDEAGAAFTGRRADFSEILAQLPHTLTDAQALLGQLVSDNHTLANLVTTSDQFVGSVAARRTQLEGLIDSVGQASVSVAARRADLSQTLERAPATLASLHTFLGRLQSATVPLGPAAREITDSAPPLTAALDQVAPFTRAATPTFNAATEVAPAVTQLADGATPVLAQANPVVASLSTFSTALTPISGILNHSVDNILAVVDNWSRAIQFRDGLSHVFRGEASMTADVLESLVDRMLAQQQSAQKAHQPESNTHAQPAAQTPSASRPTPASPAPAQGAVGTVQQIVSNVVNTVTQSLPLPGQGSSGSQSGQLLQPLLNFLLGK